MQYRLPVHMQHKHEQAGFVKKKGALSRESSIKKVDSEEGKTPLVVKFALVCWKGNVISWILKLLW